MARTRWLVGFVVAAASICAAFAQNYAPPPPQAPDAATLQSIAEKTLLLAQLIEADRRQGVQDPYLADAEIYQKAASWIVRLNEFYQPQAAAWTVAALDRGLLRARQLSQGDAPWLRQTGQAVVRAYRSRIDDSLQPYAVTFPADYGKDPAKKWRLDVVLHGRDPSLTEIKFLEQHSGNQAAPAGQSFVQLEIYGRGNNGYRWAGETDVIEAIDNFLATERMLRREQLLDPARVVLRGFSMGGAGTWHLGLHSPSRWCLVGPGAGFTTTHGYVKGLPERLPPVQEACLHIYDAADYAENVSDVPVVAYAGDRDPQLQAARTIEAHLKPFDLSIKLLVAPGLGHRFPPEWQKKAEEAYAPFVARGRDPHPQRVRFVTYTLRYPSCAWVEILGLDRHYERALVDAEQTETGCTVKTINVRALHLSLASMGPTLELKIDDQAPVVRPALQPDGSQQLYLEKKAGQWRAVLPQKLLTERLRALQKTAGLQGPIDDAFMDSFLCVRGTGTPWHDEVQKYAEAGLEQFRDDWQKYFRGSLPIKRDDEVTDDDISRRNLILFGDPGSNSVLAQVLDGLPLQWGKDRIRIGDKSYAAAEHVPVLIYPSPLNPTRYVVLNSGHTFHAADLRGTNALLYPRLGDYAVLKVTGGETPTAEVATSGLFDDDWRTTRAK
jgi:predicted esterase